MTLPPHTYPVAPGTRGAARGRGLARWALVAAAVLALSAALASCAHVKRNRGVCAEYRNIRCLTQTLCSFDERRGCRVCQCAPPDYRGGHPPDDGRDETPGATPTETQIVVARGDPVVAIVMLAQAVVEVGVPSLQLVIAVLHLRPLGQTTLRRRRCLEPS